ncbi:MAG: exosome protein [Candidatus Methanoplasma sp.]|jgi:RNA binding exosome subunit|nr:exosome protein [Candidatus Methanoplasma sp.]
MQGAFHWLRVQVFCYATEREDLIRSMITDLAGDGVEEESSEGEHGNRLTVFGKEMTRQAEFRSLFEKLGPGVRGEASRDMEARVDEDCVFRLRLDRQRLAEGALEIAHHGDVLSITGKIVAHPARKGIAVSNLRGFLETF